LNLTLKTIPLKSWEYIFGILTQTKYFKN